MQKNINTNLKAAAKRAILQVNIWYLPIAKLFAWNIIFSTLSLRKTDKHLAVGEKIVLTHRERK